jgi:hypothetical protein
MKPFAGAGEGSAAENDPATGKDRATGKAPATGNSSAAGRGAAAAGDAGETGRRSHEKVRSEPADFGGPQPEDREDQAERQGFDRQRLEPQDQPPADVLDRGNLAGEKDFELGPGKD